jgi:alpha-amylase/alpha-mannosidase (GH57 family)
MDRYLCVHAHFYQPPRENPWLEAIEVQDSAYPYHDWNERITAECYAPNTAARILDGEGRIEKLLNNYSKISFNFGPTVLSWLQNKAADVYGALRATDSETRGQHSGHGNAISQAYNHMILPLANTRDVQTQVVWGIRDFQTRFGRAPEGMWLPEGAVNLACLDALAANGIAFTILSPFSASRVRGLRSKKWDDVSGGKIDPSRAYRVDLPSGKNIAVFFYDGSVSRAVAFENILERGEDFANRLLGAFSDQRDWPQLAHIATDGETYGHHKPHGDMALAYALDYIEQKQLAKLTNYAEFLEKYPPAQVAEIFENSSWSCAHGVERWKSNCGCNSGGHAGWNQEWRAPLREAYDWLRDSLAPIFETQGKKVFADPWRARDEYIRVVLDRSPEIVCDFLRQQAGRALNDGERILALRLLEMQRHAMLMYTSCGWFFDELSGLETVQTIQYAGRAVQLADRLNPEAHLEDQLLDRLADAKSNIPEQGDGRAVYQRHVKSAMLDLPKVGGHYAISSLFEEFPQDSKLYCYSVHQEDFQQKSSGKTKLVSGHVRITSDITTECADLSFGAVHLGDHAVTGGVRQFRGNDEYSKTVHEFSDVFNRGDFTELVRVADREFGGGNYSLRLLFRDEQRKVAHLMLAPALEEAEGSYRQLYEHRAPLMHFLADLNLPPVRQFQVAAEFTLNAELKKAVLAEKLNASRIGSLLEEVKRIGVSIDKSSLEFAMRKRLEEIAEQYRSAPTDLGMLQEFDSAVDVAKNSSLDVQLWKAQNAYFDVRKTEYAKEAQQAKTDKAAADWVNTFRALGEKLSVRME